MILVHAVKKKEWYNIPKMSKFYWNKSLNKDGFIHCCSIENIAEVANSNFADVKDDMLLLCIDTSLLKSQIKWERPKNNSGMSFPHIYGKINKNSIINIVNFRRNENGKFYLPNEILKYVKYEKSCGAIILHRFNSELKILVINHVSGCHWAFPKGHMELYENEVDTALREIKEETGLDVIIDQNFRKEVRYSPRRGIVKDVVYFVARVKDKPFVKLQKEEIKDYKWCTVAEAERTITHINNVRILNEAMEYINNKKQGFWGLLDRLIKQNKIVIYRSKDSKYSKFTDTESKIEYGYVEDGKSFNGKAVDVFLGSLRERRVTGILCDMDVMSKSLGIKILIGCNKEEKKKIVKFVNDSNYTKSILVNRA